MNELAENTSTRTKLDMKACGSWPSCYACLSCLPARQMTTLDGEEKTVNFCFFSYDTAHRWRPLATSFLSGV